MPIKFWSAFVLLLFVATSCVERFFPEVDKGEGLLVVDGGITNEPGPYTVRLNRSIGVYDFQKEYVAIANAEVQIVEEGGNSVFLTEVEPGVYQTDSLELRGMPGRRYQLSIRLSSGDTYETPFETMPEPTPISSIDARIEYQYNLDEDADIPGYQFYVNAGPGPYEKNYYLWRCEATYQYRADYPITDIFEGSLEEFANPDSLTTCWRTFVVDEIFTLSTADFSTTEIEQAPILFQRVDGKVVSIRYSLLTKQYSINEPAYVFWNAIKNQIANAGSLYNTQPYQIRGNVVNVADEGESVLGYFLVAAGDEKRVFVNKPTDPDIQLALCAVDAMAVGPALMSPPAEWPIYLTRVEGSLVVSNDGCLDCRAIGGTIVKPAFWID